MDLLDIIMASNKSGGEPLAYTEKGKVYTYDGGENGHFEQLGNLRYILLSKDVPDLHNIVNIECILARSGLKVEFKKGDFTIDENYEGTGMTAVMVSFGGQTAPVLCAHASIGLFGFADPTKLGYCSRVEFADIIHPIDPKYIPGAVLPVVEISTIPTVEGAQLTEMEVAAIKATEGMPFIGKFQLDIAGTGTPIPFSVIFTGVIMDEMVFFEAETYIGVRLIFNIGKPSNSGVENTFSYRLAG